MIILVFILLILLFFVKTNQLDIGQILQSPPPRAVLQWQDLASEFGTRDGIPKNLILAVIWQESSGNPDAIGSAGEVGLMQLTELAALDVFTGSDGNENIMTALRHPILNINAGSTYLALNKSRLQGNLNASIRAYNAGIGRVQNNPRAGQNYLNSILNKWEKINNFYSNSQTLGPAF